MVPLPKSVFILDIGGSLKLDFSKSSSWELGDANTAQPGDSLYYQQRKILTFPITE